MALGILLIGVLFIAGSSFGKANVPCSFDFKYNPKEVIAVPNYCPIGRTYGHICLLLMLQSLQCRA